MAETGHSKYYYDYTRNMSKEQEKEFYEKNHCGKPNCDSESCLCEKHLGFDSWIEELEQSEQVACNIENQEDCDNCGS